MESEHTEMESPSTDDRESLSDLSLCESECMSVEELIDEGVQMMNKLLTIKDADEREFLHLELLQCFDRVATLMSATDSKLLVKAAKHVTDSPSNPLEIIYSFLLECFNTGK